MSIEWAYCGVLKVDFIDWLGLFLTRGSDSPYLTDL